MASVTCGLTAEDRDQLQNPTLVSSMGLHFIIVQSLVMIGVGLLVVMIWLKLCTTYSSSCHHHLHHPLLQYTPANPDSHGNWPLKRRERESPSLWGLGHATTYNLGLDCGVCEHFGWMPFLTTSGPESSCNIWYTWWRQLYELWFR